MRTHHAVVAYLVVWILGTAVFYSALVYVIEYYIGNRW
jgi:hypothetical protein